MTQSGGGGGGGDVGPSGGDRREEPQRTHDMHKNYDRGGRYDNDRDGGRDRYNDRDRGYDSRERGRDNKYDDRDRGYDRDRDMNRGYNRGEQFDNNRSLRDQSRQGRGLGFDDNSSRSRGRDDREWDRDRGGSGGGGSMGRGRGRSSSEMNFVRSERDRDDFGRDNNNNNMDTRGMENSATLSSGMGRGRGRGRGGSINQPAWMTSGSTSGPVGIDGGDSSTSKNAETDENLEKLLAQAKQLQQEQTKRDNQRRSSSSSSVNNSLSQRGNNISSNSSRNGNNKQSKSSSTHDDEAKLAELQKEAEEAAKKAEEERKRIEREREEEEQRQLRALVGDISDDDTNMKDDNSKKRKDNDNDGEGDLFEFETEEEREERLANKRREERKKKMRKLEESALPKTIVKDDMKVDQPRNVSGIIQSEFNADDVTNTGATNMEVEESNQVKEEDDDSGADSFDIFGTDNAIPETQTSKNAMTTNKSAHSNAQECDDAEGYYKSNIGEIITLPKERRADMYDDEGDTEDRTSRFRVLGIIGKGVFSSVIKCVEETNTGNTNTNNEAGGRIIAMKIIRNNEIMAKAAAKEMRILRMLCHQKPRTSKKKPKKDKEGVDNEVEDEDDEVERERRERENHNIVRLLDVDPTMSSSSSKDTHHYAAPPPEFRRHCIFLFEFLPFNLREVLSKFGKNVGINLTAVRSYGRQLLCALAHLERHRVVHADLKPDNILVSANFSTVKLADFGSAFFETDHDNDPTPYLVSRFYRPPEVILGLEYNRMVDLWSLSVTLAELFTGTVLFPGKSNNDMLVRFMDAMGPFSHKMVKRHALSYTKMGLQPHFEVGTGGTYQLRKQDVDRVTGQPVCRLETVLSAKPESRLASVLLKASKGAGAPGERVELLKFADFLNRCLALDPAKRLSVRDALKHDHQQRTKKKVVKDIPTEIK